MFIWGHTIGLTMDKNARSGGRPHILGNCKVSHAWGSFHPSGLQHQAFSVTSNRDWSLFSFLVDVCVRFRINSVLPTSDFSEKTIPLRGDRIPPLGRSLRATSRWRNWLGRSRPTDLSLRRGRLNWLQRVSSNKAGLGGRPFGLGDTVTPRRALLDLFLSILRLDLSRHRATPLWGNASMSTGPTSNEVEI